MSEKKISYLSRNFDDYKSNLIEIVEKYYPQVSNTLNDASIGSWLIDVVASVSDNLSYHIDRVYNETNIDSAQELSSLYSLARSNGLKIPGPKGSMTEVEFSCELPVNTEYANSTSTQGIPNWYFAPVIKKGTKLSAGSQIFEVMSDIDFAEQFDENGVSNRTIVPKRNSNGNIEKYVIKKLAVVVAGESKIYRKTISEGDIVPFMEIILPDSKVMNVESIIFKPGNNFQSDPSINEFMYEEEYTPSSETITKTDVYRYFEVDSLLEQYRWGDTNKDGNQNVAQPVIYKYGYTAVGDFGEVMGVVPTAAITKGEWKPLTQKFITEFTDKGYLKIVFGSGEQAGQTVSIDGASNFSKNQISRMIKNDSLGKLPSAGWTMFVLYRVGGGIASNVAKGAVNSIVYLNAEIGKCIRTDEDQKIVSAVKNSLKVTNTIPSVSGKDMPTEDEIRNMIKYNNASQKRCVTVKDYESRILQMPPQYGTPFRVGAIEENNKIMIYLLGIDYLGHLNDILPAQLVKNIMNYLSRFKSINDFVEMKSGRIINLSFDADLYINKNYNKSDVVTNVINTIKEYMDVNKHQMGEDIFVGDLEKEISKVDGVINLIELRVYNEFGEGYSQTTSSQQVYIPSTCEYSAEFGGETENDGESIDSKQRLDLEASDGILYTDNDSMLEIKYPEKDIRIRVKTR